MARNHIRRICLLLSSVIKIGAAPRDPSLLKNLSEKNDNFCFFFAPTTYRFDRSVNWQTVKRTLDAGKQRCSDQVSNAICDVFSPPRDTAAANESNKQTSSLSSHHPSPPPPATTTSYVVQRTATASADKYVSVKHDYRRRHGVHSATAADDAMVIIASQLTCSHGAGAYRCV